MLFCFSIDRIWKIPDASYFAIELQFPLNRKVKILLCVYARINVFLSGRILLKAITFKLS